MLPTESLHVKYRSGKPYHPHHPGAHKLKEFSAAKTTAVAVASAKGRDRGESACRLMMYAAIHVTAATDSAIGSLKVV